MQDFVEALKKNQTLKYLSFTKYQKIPIVAIIKGTKSENIIKIINTIPVSRRSIVKEITLDMAGSMNRIAKKCFPKATIVTDRFHV